MTDHIKSPWTTNGDAVWRIDTGGGNISYQIYDNRGTPIGILALTRLVHEDRLDAIKNMVISAPDMYNALWEAVELSDRELPPSGRTHECQRVYDLCRAALKRAEGDA